MSEEQTALEAHVAEQEIREWQLALLTRILSALVILAVPVLLLAIYYVAKDRSLGFIPFYGIAFGLLLVLRFWKRIPYTIRAGGFLCLTYAIALSSLLRAGLGSNAQIFLIGLPFAAMLFLGRSAGWVCLGITFTTMIVFGILFSAGVLSIPVDVEVTTHKPEAWASYTFTLVWAGAFFVMTQSYLRSRLTSALTQSRVTTYELDAQRELAERDAVNAQLRAEQMGWIAAFGNTLTSLRDRDLLVRRVVQDLLQNFALYQVSLFVIDRSGGMLNPVAAAGELGEAWINAGQQVMVGGRSLLGRVAQSGKEQLRVLAPDELEYLPGSRVEVAFPLTVRGELLGVLDFHSAASAFPEEILQLFRIVVSYVSGALDTLRLFEESEQQIHEIRMLYTQHVVASWRSLLEADALPEYSLGTLPNTLVRELAETAMREQKSQSVTLEDEQGYLLVVPLIARGVTLGHLAFVRSASKGDWDQEARTMIEVAADRLALSLDNTRLLVEVRRQAFYQEQLRHVNDVIWRNPRPETIMEQSVRELGRFLGAGEVQLYIAPEQREETSG